MSNDGEFDSKINNSALISALEDKFAELNELLYTTSVPNEQLERRVLPYIADDVIFRDPWQEGGHKAMYAIVMKGGGIK
jgi:hypothetical protein